MKRTYASLLCLTLLACVDENDDTQVFEESASTPAPTFESNTSLELLVVDQASCVSDSQRTQPGFEVYENPELFRAAYNAARPDASHTPTIDFEKYVVVAAYLGEQPSCGTEVEIAGATVQNDRVDVDVKVTRGDGCTEPTRSYPFAFARLNRVDRPYFATERTELRRCLP